MTNPVREACELSLGELDIVNGGSMLGMALDIAQKYLDGLGGRLIDAVHQPLTPKPSMSLHKR